jgi:hypothetical protein
VIVDLVRVASNAIPEIYNLKSEICNDFGFVEEGAEVYTRA